MAAPGSRGLAELALLTAETPPGKRIYGEVKPYKSEGTKDCSAWVGASCHIGKTVVWKKDGGMVLLQADIIGRKLKEEVIIESKSVPSNVKPGYTGPTPRPAELGEKIVKAEIGGKQLAIVDNKHQLWIRSLSYDEEYKYTHLLDLTPPEPPAGALPPPPPPIDFSAGYWMTAAIGPDGKMHIWTTEDAPNHLKKALLSVGAGAPDWETLDEDYMRCVVDPPGGKQFLSVSAGDHHLVYALRGINCPDEIWTVGQRVKERFSRAYGFTTVYSESPTRILLPRATAVTCVEAGDKDRSLAITDVGAFTWGPDVIPGTDHWSESGWSKQYRPTPRPADGAPTGAAGAPDGLLGGVLAPHTNTVVLWDRAGGVWVYEATKCDKGRAEAFLQPLRHFQGPQLSVRMAFQTGPRDLFLLVEKAAEGDVRMVNATPVQ
ncbi:unnamed protein product [Pedinophyceae sp. YPF-701]|nr:unnamed protein product [Pedinophyceae sp. YPF-701]